MTPKATRCLSRLLEFEGGWKPNEPGDPESYRGINRNEWPSWGGWKVVDESKPLKRGTKIMRLEPEVLAFYQVILWDKYRLEELDEAMATVLLDYFANSGAGPARYSRLDHPGPFDVLRDRGHYMVDLACGFVSSRPEQVEYWTESLTGWMRRLRENLLTVRALGAAPPQHTVTEVPITAPAFVPAQEVTMLKSLISWRTTALGFLLGISILVGEAKDLLDEDPTTEFNYRTVTEALAAMGLGWFARDNKVTSEMAGAK